MILQLQQENSELKNKTSSQLEVEFKNRMKLEDHVRALEKELEKANQFIQFQHQVRKTISITYIRNSAPKLLNWKKQDKKWYN